MSAGADRPPRLPGRHALRRLGWALEDRRLARAGWRAPMSRGLFAALARERGLRVETQLDSWGPGGRYDLSAFADAITVCRR